MILGVGLLALLAVGFLGKIADNVTIGGLDIGGMNRWQASRALKEAARETVLRQNLTLVLPEETLALTPEEMGLTLHARNAIRDAYQVGRKEEATQSHLALTPYLEVNEEAIRARLSQYAQDHGTTLTGPTYVLTGQEPALSTENAMEDISCQTLELTVGLPTARLDVEAALAATLDALDRGISACREGAYTLTLEVPASEIPDAPDLEAIAEALCREPVNDSLDLESYGFVHGSYGYGFDMAQAEALLSQAGYGQTLSLPMTLTAPEIQGDGVYFRDVLGTCDTKHGDNENRNNNLRLLCQALDGFVLQPGEEFSYNAVVGERTKERGYLPAPAYSGNRLTDSVGGGVCQGSSTLYNCVLLADLEVTSRACHGAFISYLPLGLDAAVSWGLTDFCFRNNWHFPIMIQAETTEDYVKMRILGTDEKDYYLKLEAYNWEDGDITRATSYKRKFDKETDEDLGRERIAFSTYYSLG